ncbi:MULTISPECIES: Imm70 family immunity protein [Modicisalibacter]|uniref:Imm70 family immunity protein n=1 Tax=Modicisalibacter TaxID=574347 RepID=UPI00100B166D|nr:MULTISPECIES: Imm70 family immunity protein [Halomonadaceae]MBZ9557493.1 immunity 70 family protein [Modicisalibacter sp. R2A 31.J]MBZ9573841.1 immunity 70 family protein [Modicisalibacter sp. MOD 31.J]
MSVGIKVGSIIDEIGTSNFLHAFFSTVSANLESNGWGTCFPIVLGKLYQGYLEPGLANQAISELTQIRKALSDLEPARVVWDIEHPTRQPPWGNKISSDITSLANYFVTSTGRDLISTLIEALEDAAKGGKPAAIVQY